MSCVLVTCMALTTDKQNNYIPLGYISVYFDFAVFLYYFTS